MHVRIYKSEHHTQVFYETCVLYCSQKIKEKWMDGQDRKKEEMVISRIFVSQAGSPEESFFFFTLPSLSKLSWSLENVHVFL